MITIQREQTRMFVQAAIDRFIVETMAHVREQLPEQHATLGDDGVRERVCEGFARASSYRLRSEAAVRAFIELMVLHGRNFDTDPALPWAARWLHDPRDETTRIHGLRGAARGPSGREEGSAKPTPGLDPDGKQRLTDRVAAQFPIERQLLGDAGIARLVELGAKRAGVYGFTTEDAVYLYLCHMVFLGSYFDTDPQLPWAESILHDTSDAPRPVALATLRRETAGYLNEAVGTDGRHHRRALRRFRRRSYASLPERPEELAIWLEDLYPQKLARTRSAHPQLLKVAMEEATPGGLTDSAPFTLFVTLTVLLGSGFARDPLFPWAAEALNLRPATPDQRARALYDAAFAEYDRSQQPVLTREA